MAAGYHYGVKLRITPTGLSPASAAASLAALPPPALPGFLGTTGPSATPTGPACPSRGSGSRVPRHRRGFPCCAPYPLPCVPPPLPRRNRSVPVSLTCRTVPAFPVRQAGRLPHHNVSRPAQRSLTFRPACSLNRLSRSFCQSASIHVVTSMNRPDCYQPETIVAGRDSHPLERGAFHGARGSRANTGRDGRHRTTSRESERHHGTGATEDRAPPMETHLPWSMEK